MIKRSEHNFYVSYAAWAQVIMAGFFYLASAPTYGVVFNVLLAAGITAVMYGSNQK